MVDELKDGLVTEPSDVQPPTEPVEPQEPVELTEPTEPVEPQELDDGEEPIPQVGDENALRAWIGRRDKRLRDDYDIKLKQTVDSIIQGITPVLQQAHKPPEVAPQPQYSIDPNELDFVTDPMGSFNKLAKSFVTDYMPKYNAQVTNQQRQKAMQVLNGITSMAKNDPLIKDDADRITEIAKTLDIPNFDNLDAQTATSIAFTQAQNILFKEKLTKKINPLAKNKPVNQPVGTITPSARAASPKPKVSVSNEVLETAAKMGLTEAEALELLKE